jgi:hypothetical protein
MLEFFFAKIQRILKSVNLWRFFFATDFKDFARKNP